MTALLNPEQDFLVTDNLNVISDALKKADEVYSPEVKKHFDEYGEHCLSVMFHWRVPVFHLREESVGLYGRCISVPIFKAGASSEDVFNRLNKRLMSSVGF